MLVPQSDLRLVTRTASSTISPFYLNPARSNLKLEFSRVLPRQNAVARRSAVALYGDALSLDRRKEKGSICTADELHYVPLSSSDWSLALWRYLPSPLAPPRNHPLLLLSGVGTNAIGYDLSPDSSFARYMSGQGFDTWILELRGAGLSTEGVDLGEGEQLNNNSEPIASIFNSGKQSIHVDRFADSDISSAKGKSRLIEIVMRLSEKVASFLNEGQNSAAASQIRDLSQMLTKIIEESQLSASLPLFNFQERFATTLADFQKQIDLIVKYNWDFDHYLEEDMPAAMEYIRTRCRPKDGKLLAIGHSMGGILLYAMLSRCGFDGIDSRLASVATLASSLDYTSSKSSLKLLLPLRDPAQALNVPVIPFGTLMAAAHPLASRPPYLLSWLSSQISAKDMMRPELLEKLVMNNFCTIPSKLLIQLTTVFRERGLCDRSGIFYYKEHLHKSKVPVLALAGDHDLICPPEAVYETVKVIPEHLVSYKVLGEPGGPHYAHYDLVGGLLAAEQVYPLLIEFLNRHDEA